MTGEPERDSSEACEQLAEKRYAEDILFSANVILAKAALSFLGAYLLMDDRPVEAIVLAAAGLLFTGFGIAGRLDSRLG